MAQRLGGILESAVSLKAPRSMAIGVYIRSFALLLLSAAAACTSSGTLSGTESLRAGSILIHSGSVDYFREVDCVRIEAADTASDIDVGQHIRRELLAAGLNDCGSSTAGVQLRAFYQAGPGVCIDCAASTDGPRSGFALIAIEQGGSERARAEWQYTSGGSAEVAASAFGRDLVKLLRKGSG